MPIHKGMSFIAERLGETILTSEPYVHVLSQAERGKRCDQCFDRSLNPLMRCSACSAMRYCNATCQKKAWTIHKEECKCIQRVAPNFPKENVRIMYHLLLKFQNDLHINEHENIFGQERSFNDLMSHSNEIRADEKKMVEFEILCQTLKVYAGKDFKFPHTNKLLEFFGKMTVNSFSICDGEMQAIGTGIYLGPSMFDHDCHPNAIAVFNGAELIVRSLTTIEVDDKVLISYLDQLAPTPERRKELEDQYYFTCKCAMCQDTNMSQVMLSTLCPTVTEGCIGVVLQNEDGKFKCCTKCGRDKFDENYRRAKRQTMMKSIMELKEMKKLKSQGEANAILQKSELLLKEQSTVLSPMNIYYVRAVDMAFDACIDLALWKKALEYGKLNLDPYWTYYHRFHPNIGILLLKIGKIQLYLHQLEAAYKMLQQAEAILKITHGSKHALYGELCCLLGQCAEEMRMKLQSLKLKT